MAELNTGMSRADMRGMLNRIADEPIGCAVGIGDDQNVALFVMHKTKSGKACEKMLKDEFPKARNVRFGTAFVSPDEPKEVKLTLNVAVSGIAKKLAKTLKGTGFTKVILMLEDGSLMEKGEEAEEVAAGAPAANGAAPAPGAPPRAPAPPTAAASPEAVAANADDLKKKLATLMGAIKDAAGENAEFKAKLTKLATDANVNIKFNNLTYAANFIDQLRIAIENAPKATVAPATLQDIEKSRQIWTGTQSRVKAEVDKLRGALAKTYEGQPFAAEIGAKFQSRVQAVVEGFDDRLLDVLQDVMDTKDPAARAALITQGQDLIKEYLAYASSEPLIADLDNNPFAPLAIRTTVTTMLGALAKSIH